MLRYSVLLTIFHITLTYGNKLNTLPFTEQKIKEENYLYEIHTVQTTDGYIVTIYNIKRNEAEHELPPAVMMHGMGASSDDFVLLGRDSLAFMMADAGYDVWLLNARHVESSLHVNISREDDAYWEYSWDEMAKYDLSESVDYVLKSTGAEKIIYIGFSFANPMYLMMLNERPDLSDRIAVHVVLSASYFNTLYQPYAEILHRLIGLGLFRTYFLGGKNRSETKSKTKTASELKENYNYYFTFVGYDWDQVDWNNSQNVMGRSSYISLNQYAHLFQIFKDGNLAKFDYGLDENIKKYGTPKPPSYSWKVLKAPTVLYFGKNDRPMSQDLHNIVKMLKTSSSKVYTRISTWKYFNHLDFIAGRTVSKELYVDLLNVLKKILKL